MKLKYSYIAHEDCLAATEISKSRQRNKIFFILAWGWILLFAVISFFALLLSEDAASQIAGIIVSLLIIIVSGGCCWHIVARYDQTTDKRINAAISKYIAGNKKFLESDKRIDSLSISAEIIHKQCMGCGHICQTQRCDARKNGYAITLPLCEKCICKLKSKVK